jgi:alpha-ketoglutarate-dependent 2,4-dichlorophenoxyacetate dioxygenase
MMNTTQLHPRYGLRIDGLDLRQITDDQFAGLRAAFEEHSVLYLPGQEISDADHIALARRFGPLEDRDAADLAATGDFKVPEVSNIRADGSVTGAMDLHTLQLKANMMWHCDSTFLPIPALTNILVARVVTETGGATELASTRAGWADMPDALKARVRDKAFWHHYSHSRAKISPELAAKKMFHNWPAQLWRAVWTNPVTGDEALYVASHAFGVEGMDEAEGAALIDEVTAFVTQPQYVYSHQWAPGDVLIWDQRAVLHRATPWNYDEPRKLTSICVSATDRDGLTGMRLTQ